MSAHLLLRGGCVVDPSLGQSGRADVRVRNGRVVALGRLTPEAGEVVLDVDGLVATPGLIDVHVHLREPGQEWKETIGTGSAAGAAGGFTAMFCMPNTQPPLDSVAALEELQARIARDAVIDVRPIATITEGRRLRRAADFDALAAVGAVAFSDDGESTENSAVMAEALRATKRLGVPVMVHCEDATLIGGAMHEGDISRQLGIRGIPAEAEEITIDRDLALAEQTGGWLHVCHVSTAAGIQAIDRVRRRGARVTAEVMPHHLTATEVWVAGERQMVNANEPVAARGRAGDPDTKVNPPLRPEADAIGLLQALQQGLFEVISTDHAPHARTEKQGRPYANAAFGLSGSEFALPTMLALVRAGKLTLAEVIAGLSTRPATLWGLPTGTLRPGSPADIMVFDPEERWVANEQRLVTRSLNSPLIGAELQGRVKLTLVHGDVRHRDW